MEALVMQSKQQAGRRTQASPCARRRARGSGSGAPRACTERQWIFWWRVGARFCASQLNSKSWLSCRVASVQRDSRGSSGTTCGRPRPLAR